MPRSADVLFIALVLCILPRAGTGMLDDPGLGWHLRNADQMWEDGAFQRTETFCGPTQGRPLVSRDWLGDILFRLAYGWGGLAGIAVLTTLVLALVLRLLYTGMCADDVPWLVAIAWTLIATLGTAPSWVARPNVFSILGLVLTVQICRQYHCGTISARKTLWLLPLFLLWTNLHGGFIAGLVTLLVTYAVECAIALLGPNSAHRAAARRRVAWLTFLGAAVGLVTLINPYGIGLHVWNVRVLSDPFTQTRTTIEWQPPDFRLQGWFVVELLILVFPLLAATSRRRIDLVSLALAIVWLHFCLVGRRYAAMWTVVVVPVLAMLSCRVPWLQLAVQRVLEPASPELHDMLRRRPRRSAATASIVFATLLLLLSPWLSSVAAHNPKNLPTAALDRLLALSRGETVFHSINWGGYLTWHGWNLKPRFKTWIDDRTDVHGRQHTQQYFDIMAARPGWQKQLQQHHVGLLCLPVESRLAQQAAESPDWSEVFRQQGVVVFRRNQAAHASASGAHRPPQIAHPLLPANHRRATSSR